MPARRAGGMPPQRAVIAECLHRYAAVRGCRIVHMRHILASPWHVMDSHYCSWCRYCLPRLCLSYVHAAIAAMFISSVPARTRDSPQPRTRTYARPIDGPLRVALGPIETYTLTNS